MMASFLPVIVSKKNKHCSVSQIHINPKKKQKKHQNDYFGRTYLRLHEKTFGNQNFPLYSKIFFCQSLTPLIEKLDLSLE